MSDEYHVEFEIQGISKKVTVTNDVRISLKSDKVDKEGKDIWYAGTSTGKYAITGLDKLERGDFVSLRVQDSGDFHNIKKILDVAKPIEEKDDTLEGHEKGEGEGEVAKEKGAPEKSIAEPSGTYRERFEPQEIGMWYKEAGENLRSGLVDKKTPAGQKLAMVYFARMYKVLGIKPDEESA